MCFIYVTDVCMTYVLHTQLGSGSRTRDAFFQKINDFYALRKGQKEFSRHPFTKIINPEGGGAVIDKK